MKILLLLALIACIPPKPPAPPPTPAPCPVPPAAPTCTSATFPGLVRAWLAMSPMPAPNGDVVALLVNWAETHCSVDGTVSQP